MNKNRIEWLDNAKGIAIFLVVLGHTLRGLPAGSGKGEDWAVFIDAWIYTFHMPVFFVLSGLFIEASAAKPFGSFLRSKISTILYPYFLWSILQELMRSATGAASLHDLWRITYQPVMQFWFLYVLFLLGILYAVLRKLRLPAWAFGIVVLLLYILPQCKISLGSWAVIYMLALNGIYFAYGALDGANRLPARFEPFFPRSLLVFAMVIFAFLFVAVAKDIQTNAWVKPLLGLAGTAATLAVANALFRTGHCSFLLKWGKLSMEIFVAHTIFSAGIRTILEHSHITNTWVHLSAGLLAGMAGPILLVALLNRFHFPFLFSLSAARKP